jgi:hypothetical protein
LSQDRRGGGAVTCDVVRLLRDFLDQLRADLLERVLELDLLGDRDAVVGDRGDAPLLLQDDVAALWAESDLDGVGQLVHAALQAAPRLLVEGNNLRHGVGVLPGGIWQFDGPAKTTPATDGRCLARGGLAAQPGTPMR